jgi:hypothetical protein
VQGRILEERKTDASGTILHRIEFAYDSDGNRSAVKRHAVHT